MAVPVALEIGGARRELRYDLNALEAIQEKAGLNLLDPPEDVGLFSKPTTVKVLLWAGLLHSDPLLDLTEVGRWVTLGDLERVSDAIGDALKASKASEVSPERAGPPTAPAAA